MHISTAQGIFKRGSDATALQLICEAQSELAGSTTF